MERLGIATEIEHGAANPVGRHPSSAGMALATHSTAADKVRARTERFAGRPHDANVPRRVPRGVPPAPTGPSRSPTVRQARVAASPPNP